MAKEIMDEAPEQSQADVYPVQGAHYHAIVFKRVASSKDFSCGRTIVLPGAHQTPAEAWAAVWTALRTPGVIGGEIRPALEA